MHTQELIYNVAAVSHHGYLACLDEHDSQKPAILIVHDWTGRNAFAMDKAHQLAELGYVGFAIDMYGEARIGDNNEEKSALMQPLMNDRSQLIMTLQEGLKALKKAPQVNPQKVMAIGFCFGGLCVLDLARSGADIQAVASFHGLLHPPEGVDLKPIRSKVLVLHGYDDPMVPPAQVHAFCDEMTQAQADWQIHMYGLTQHAFTNPLANDPNFGTVYSDTAAQRSWQALLQFIKESLD